MKKIYIVLISIACIMIFLGIESVGFFDISYSPTHVDVSSKNSPQPKQYAASAQKVTAQAPVNTYVAHHEEAESEEEGEPEHKKEKQETLVVPMFDPYQFLKNAVIADNISLIKSLIVQGDDLNLIDPATGQNLLHVAAIYNVVDIFTVLLDQGLNLYAKDINNYTPLDYAKKYNYVKIMQAACDYTNRNASITF